jgi:REP element-mobilizing transposase RayT
VIGRGIERGRIFRDESDRKDFLNRLADLSREKAWTVYAWALVPNHFHLLVRTGNQPLAQSMRRLLTGYVVNFNRRHRRYGHLFQNRYKSIICEEDPYLLELTRYIHLNPLRSRIVKGLEELKQYPWGGHSAVVGKVKRDWQAVDAVLAYFGKGRKKAIQRYEEFVAGGVSQGRRPELVGGGLIRSVGGWSEVLSLRRRGTQAASDQRILGSSEFVEDLLSEAEWRTKETLRISKKIPNLATLAREIARKEDFREDELRSGSRKKGTSRVRRLFCQLAVREMGYTGAEVARFLGVTTSAVNRAKNSEKVPELRHYL